MTRNVWQTAELLASDVSLMDLLLFDGTERSVRDADMDVSRLILRFGRAEIMIVALQRHLENL